MNISLKKISFSLVLFCIPWLLLAQESSNKGTNFWLGFTGHLDTNLSSMSLYITSDVNTTGTVSVPLQGWSVNFSITANTTTTVNVPNNVAYVNCSDCIQDRGIHVTSVLPVVIYSHIYNSTHSDATLVLPVPTLGKEYYAMAFTQKPVGPNEYSEFLVAATEDSTTVQITPKHTTLGGQPPNVAFNVLLMEGQVYQLQSDSDLTGSKILSQSTGSSTCKRIAVFSGSTYDQLGCVGSSSGDNLYQQIYPINAWGSNFITAPFKTRVGGDVFRVLAGYNGTTVTFNGGATFNLNTGQFHDTLSSVANYITSNHPITLAQYQRSQNCDGVTGDPSMTILNPVEQTLDTITLFSSPFVTITGEYINVIMKTTDTSLFRLDGLHVPFLVAGTNPLYSYARNTVTSGNHTLIADSGFNAIAYGFGSFESYGYNAGANVRSLDQYFTASSNGVGNVSTTCVGSVVNFVSTTSYTPSSWLWYFGDGDTSTLALPSHTYGSSGNFTVSLVTTRPVANGCNFQDSSSYILHIVPFPNANFFFTNTCVGDSVHFQDSSIVTGSSIASWKYYFGDGDSASVQNPVHHYAGTGTYTGTLIVRSQAGCIDTVTRPVVIHALPNADAGTDVSICLGSSATLNASGGTIYQWSPTTALSSGTIPNPVANPGSNTTYSVLVTDANSCSKYDTIVVSVNIVPTAEAGSDVSICPGSNTTLGASGGTSYLWSPTTGLSSSVVSNPTADPVVTTRYSVTVTDAQGCFSSDTVHVVVHPLPLISSADTICFGSSTTLVVSGGVSYSWSPTLGLSASNISNPVASPPSSVTYTVTVTDVFSCQNELNVLVHVNLLPPVSAGSDVSFCSGDSSTLHATGALAYVWSPSVGLTTDTISNPVAHPSSPQTYIVTGTDANTCQKSDTVIVTVFALPNADAGINGTICFGDSTLLNASGGTSYLWSPSVGLSAVNIPNPHASPSDTTVYSVLVTDVHSCSLSDSTTVIVHPLPLADAGPDLWVCPGASIQLNATGGVAYSWSPTSSLDNPNSQTPNSLSSSNTTFIVVVTDIFSCVKNDTVNLSVNPVVPVNAGPDTVICFGDSIQVGSNPTAPPGSTYGWTPAIGIYDSTLANPYASPALLATYIVYVTNDTCHGHDTIIVSVNPLPSLVNAGADSTICFGVSMIIGSDSIAGNSYLWTSLPSGFNASVAEPQVSPSDTTIFILQQTIDATGCRARDSMKVSVNPLPVIHAGTDTVICFAQSVLIGSDSIPGNSYQWTSDPAGFILDSAQSTVIPSVSTIYILNQAVAITTCSATDSIVVHVNSLPTIHAGNDTVICFGQPVLIGTDSITGNTYQWTSLPSGFIYGQSDTLIYPSDTITYILLQTISATGCSILDQVHIDVNSLPIIEAGTDTSVCIGGYKFLGSDSLPGINYSWSSFPSGFSSVQSTPFVMPDLSTVYYLSGTNTITGCLATDSAKMTVFPLPHLTMAGDTLLCAGETTALHAGGGASYFWMPSAGLDSVNSSSPHANPIVSTTYFITVTDTNGCRVRDSLMIMVLPLPIANAGTDLTICPGVPSELSGSGGVAYHWTPSATLSSDTGQTVSAFPDADVDYFLQVIDQEGCRSWDTVHVTVFDKPTAVISADSMNGSKPFLVQFTNGTTGASSYHWLFGDGHSDNSLDPKHIYSDTGTFTVMLIAMSAEGCPDTTELKYIRVDGNTVIVIPNVFTPNGDFANDMFMINSKGFSQLDGQIFNRWGVLVAQVNFMNSGWNGQMSNGDEVSAGTYFYTLNALGIDGKPYQFNGFVEVIR